MAAPRERPGTLAADRRRRSCGVSFGGIGVTYTVAILAVLPYARLPGPVVPALTTTFGAVVFLADLCTSVLLLLQCRVAPSWALLLLAAAYGYSGAMAFLHVLTFPGAWVPEAVLVGTPQTVGWLFIAWILGYPLLVLLAMGAEASGRHRPLAAARSRRPPPSSGSSSSSWARSCWSRPSGRPGLPPELHGQGLLRGRSRRSGRRSGSRWPRWGRLWGSPAAAPCSTAASAWPSSHFWPSTHLAVAGGGRYTLGWVLTASGVVSASVLLVFFLGQFARLHRAVVQGLQQVRDANTQLKQRVAARTATVMQAHQALQREVAERGSSGRGGPDALAAIVESAEDAIISMTLDGIITSWNQGAERLYGYPAAEMVGQSLGRLILRTCPTIPRRSWRGSGGGKPSSITRRHTWPRTAPG